MKPNYISFLLVSLFLALVTALNSKQLAKQTHKSPLDGIIKLTKSNFQRVLDGPRDSHILVLLTATSPQVGCTACLAIHSEFEKLARSWHIDHPEGDDLFFARADFADGYPEIFQKFQLNSVPRLYLYKPTQEVTPLTVGFDALNIPPASDFAPHIASALKDLAGCEIHIYEKTDYSSIITTFIVAAITVFLSKRYNSAVRKVLGSRPLWGGATVIAIILFISGYMFNVIRNTPYIRPAQDGGIEYFIRGQQQQLGAEVQVMTIIYCILAFCTVSLINKAKVIKDERIQLIVVSAVSFSIFVSFSTLLCLFRYKSQGYPFRLLNVWDPK